jgi:hypothetical protein
MPIKLDEWPLVHTAILGRDGTDPIAARNGTVLRYMMLGDLKPLANAIFEKHPIKQEVLEALALMICENHEFKDGSTPFQIVTKPRHKRGRPKDPNVPLRDLFISMSHDRLTRNAERDKALKSEQAFRVIAEAVGVGTKTVEAAVTKGRKP